MPPAQLWILGAWAVVGAVLVGLGLLVRRFARAPARGADDLLLSFWLGWAAMVLGLQVWHLAAPVGPLARGIVAALGALGLAVGGARPAGRVVRGGPRHVLAVLAATAVLLWLSSQALGGARFGDSGAYFVPTIRWLVEHPIVPGLGNLHAHYALNQSYFLYAALLEAGPFAGRSWHLANPLLVASLCLRATLALARTVRLRHPTTPVDLFWVLLLPGILSLPAGILYTSPSPDQAVFALGAVASAELLALFTLPASQARSRLYAVVLLCAAGVTVKLSFAGFALAAVLVAASGWLRRDGRALLPTLRTAGGIGLAAAIPWCLRNVVLSGRPFYPKDLWTLPVDWRVQTDVEAWLRNTVYTGGWRAIVESPDWYAARLVSWGWTAPEVLGPLLVAAGGAGVTLVRWPLSPRRTDGLSAVLLLPALASLLYCLVLSPVPRYAGATVWLLAATATLLAARAMPLCARSRVRAVLLVASIAASVSVLWASPDSLWTPRRDFEATARVAYRARRLKTGYVVNVPRGIDSCWDAPLPCTPFPNPALQLRRPGDLRSGFLLDPAVNARYRYDPGRPWHAR